MSATIADRFWSKVRGGPVEECWQWTGGKFGPKGYGAFRAGDRRLVRAHRWVYEALIAPIPDGLTIDHLCGNTSCVNPWHMEPVTVQVNLFRTRKTHCGRGHEFTPENTLPLVNRRGTITRSCRECVRENRGRYRAAVA